MPSLKDLAKECGVSVATVSKALNDQPDIAQATRERIHAAARRMGYLPNAAARALKTNRTYNLGVLFVDEKQSGLTHEYFSFSIPFREPQTNVETAQQLVASSQR